MLPPFQIGEVLGGGAVGQVVESNNPKFKKGDHVSNFSAGGNGSSPTAGNCKRSRRCPASASRPISARWACRVSPPMRALLKVGELKGRRAGVRLGGQRRGGRDRLPDRQEQGLLCGGLRGFRRKMRMADQDRGLRQGDQLQEREKLRGRAARSFPARHRCLFRQCRRQSPERGACQHARARTHSGRAG